jgi:hypothetical protein
VDEGFLKERALTRDAQIGGQCQVGAETSGRSTEGGENRLVGASDRQNQPMEIFKGADGIRFGRLFQRGQIAPRAKGPRAPQERHGGDRVASEVLLERSRKLNGGAPVEGISSFRTNQSDDTDQAAHFARHEAPGR